MIGVINNIYTAAKNIRAVGVTIRKNFKEVRGGGGDWEVGRCSGAQGLRKYQRDVDGSGVAA